MAYSRVWCPIALAAIIFCCVASSNKGADLFTWWVTDVSQKITSETKLPLDSEQSLHLHAARQEYVPFQIVFSTGESTSIPLPSVEYPEEFFSVQLFEEFFVPLLHNPGPGLSSIARMTDVAAIADGLRPVGVSISMSAAGVAAIWVDVFVLPDTPAGDYTFTISLSDHDDRTVTITVYPVDLTPTAAMSIIIPLEANWTIPFYAPNNDANAFHRTVNQLLLDHELIPGTLAGAPVLTEQGWDFSAFDEELDTLIPGSMFYTPLPYDEWNRRYFIDAPSGMPYQQTHFEDTVFAGFIEQFFADLADHLLYEGNLHSALVYPVDETRWVADEPDHNGPEGFERLAAWTQVIHSAGLRVSASWVTPAPYAPGWVSSPQVADDLHVHVDLYDADPDLFSAWSKVSGKSSSLYLNDYGDLIDMPASIHRGLIWHAYGRGIRMIAGYAAMEWVDAHWDLIDPWGGLENLYPHLGYGGGALVWPGPFPSVRLKLLREGIEDARLLDQYGAKYGEITAQELAASLTPGALADQNPVPDVWDDAHKALLDGLNTGDVDVSHLSPTKNPIADTSVLVDFDADQIDRGRWEFGQSTIVALVESPWSGSGNALAVDFTDASAFAFYWIGESDWQNWDMLEIDVQNQSPYFADLDVALGDTAGNFVLLRGNSVLIGPERQRTLTLPLVTPFGDNGLFDWSKVAYLEMIVNTTIHRVDGFDTERVYNVGGRSLIFDNIRLILHHD